MDHLRRHVGIRTRVQSYLFVTPVMLHGECATNNSECLIRGMPVSRHVEVLRCPNDEFRSLRCGIYMQNNDVLKAVRWRWCRNRKSDCRRGLVAWGLCHATRRATGMPSRVMRFSAAQPTPASVF